MAARGATILGNVTDNGTFRFDRSDSYTFGEIVSGSGSLQQIGTGTTVLAGPNVYTGGTTISSGTLQLGNGGASSWILGNVTDNATFAIDRSNSYTFGGIISGTGAFEQLGTGTTIFTSANSYTGGTTISGGILQLGPGGSLAPAGALHVDAGSLDLNGHLQTVGDFSGAGLVTLGSGTLTAGTEFTEFSGAISGIGGFVKQGTGTTVFTGTNFYTGATTVDAGTLIVNGSIASSTSLTVNTGGTIGGIGTLPSTTINGGTLSPGNGIGTITVQGNLAFVAPGLYLVRISPTAADRTNVTGTATLAAEAGRVAPESGSYVRGTTYTILNATGGLIGTFSGLTMNSAFLCACLSYDANNVYLTIAPKNFTFADAGQTPNQIATGAAAKSSAPAIRSTMCSCLAPRSRRGRPWIFLSGEKFTRVCPG